jgi:hypothetical protein
MVCTVRYLSVFYSRVGTDGHVHECILQLSRYRWPCTYSPVVVFCTGTRHASSLRYRISDRLNHAGRRTLGEMRRALPEDIPVRGEQRPLSVLSRSFSFRCCCTVRRTSGWPIGQVMPNIA